MVFAIPPSAGVNGSPRPSTIPVDDPLERRWDAWREEGRTRDRIVQQRIRMIAAIAAITLSILLEFLSSTPA